MRPKSLARLLAVAATGIKPLCTQAATVEYVWHAPTARPVARPAGNQEKAYARVWAN